MVSGGAGDGSDPAPAEPGATSAAGPVLRVLDALPEDPNSPVATMGRIAAALDTSGSEAEAEAKTIVLRQLTAGPRSRAQLAARLAERGTDGDVAVRVLDRLESVGLIDDAEFARTWVRSRQARGLSSRAMAHELRTKGVDDEVARQALDAIDPDDELAAAEKLVQRRVDSVRGLPREKQVNRLAGMLARKGYSISVSMQVVQAALDARDLADAEVFDQD